MIRGVVTTLVLATANENEGSSLLQLNHNSESDGARIWEASRKARAGQDVCLSVHPGQRAPIAGVFKAGNHELDVQPGDVAKRAGVFCVPKNTVALLQRSLGLDSAKHMDRALMAKNEPTCEEEIENIEYVRSTDLLQMQNVTSETIIAGVMEQFKQAIQQEMVTQNIAADLQTKVNDALDVASEVNVTSVVHEVLGIEKCVEEVILPTQAPTTPAPTPAPEPGRAAFCHEIRYHSDCIATQALIKDLHGLQKPKLKACNSCEDIWVACGFGTPPQSAYGVEETTDGKR